MPRYGFVIDLKRCYGCYTCQVTCKAANHTPQGIDWARCVPAETGSFPVALRHVADHLPGQPDGTGENRPGFHGVAHDPPEKSDGRER